MNYLENRMNDVKNQLEYNKDKIIQNSFFKYAKNNNIPLMEILSDKENLSREVRHDRTEVYFYKNVPIIEVYPFEINVKEDLIMNIEFKYKEFFE